MNLAELRSFITPVQVAGPLIFRETSHHICDIDAEEENVQYFPLKVVRKKYK